MKGWGLTWAVADHPRVFEIQRSLWNPACRRKWAVADAVNPDRELKSDGGRVSYVWLSIGLAWVPLWWIFVKDPLCVGRFSFAAHFSFPNWAFHGPHLSPNVNSGSLNPPKHHHPMDAMLWTQLWMNLSTELISGFTSVTHSVRSRF
jgi:hypothetical protein